MLQTALPYAASIAWEKGSIQYLMTLVGEGGFFFYRIFLVSTPLLNVFYNSIPCLKLTAAKKSMRIAFKGFYGSKST